MDLYTEIILDHYKHPHNFGSLTNHTHSATETNTSCGDKVTIELIIKKDKVKDIKFSGEGCAISQAACSMLTDHIKDFSLQKINDLTLDDIKKLLNVEINPGRIKCATIGLITIQKALAK